MSTVRIFDIDVLWPWLLEEREGMHYIYDLVNLKGEELKICNSLINGFSILDENDIDQTDISDQECKKLVEEFNPFYVTTEQAYDEKIHFNFKNSIIYKNGQELIKQWSNWNYNEPEFILKMYEDIIPCYYKEFFENTIWLEYKEYTNEFENEMKKLFKEAESFYFDDEYQLKIINPYLVEKLKNLQNNMIE